MKPLFYMLAVLLFCSCTGRHLRQGSRAAGGDARQQVAALEDQWMQALVSKDTAVLSKILSADFTLSGSSWERETRQQYLQTSAMPERQLQPLELSDRSFRVYDHTVVSTGATTYRGQWKEKVFTLPVRYTHVFIFHNGEWQVVAAHVSSVD